MAESPVVRIDLFGRPSVKVGGKPIHLSDFQIALVALVVVEGPVSRRKVCRFLWGCDADSVTRHRLRQILHTIRKRCGERFFDARGDSLGTSPDVESDWFDAIRYLESQSFLRAAQVAAQNFLQEMVADPDHEIRRWRDGTVAGLRKQVRRAAGVALAVGETRADWEGMRDAAEALHALDSDNPEFLAQVIEARALTGQLQAAELAYVEHVHSVGREQPHPIVERAIAKARASVNRDSSKAEPRSAPFVGRVQTLATLSQLLKDVSAGKQRHALVTGEAGIGKTRVLEEVTRLAPFEGVRPLSARAVEAEHRISLSPLIDALASVELDRHLESLGDPWRTVVGTVFPLGYLRSTPTDPPPIDERSLPRRLMDAFAMLLERIAREQPTILFLDDVQWADATTLAVLCFFRRRWGDVPFGVVASQRSDPTAPTEHLLGGWTEWDQHHPVLRIELSELDDPESGELVDHLTEGRINPQSRTRILSLAANHPLYLTELARDHLSGNLDLDESCTGLPTLPISFRQILAARWSRCSRRSLSVAQAASVAGRPLSVGDLGGVLQLPVDRVIDAVEELECARLCETDHDLVWISHDLFRTAIYADLGGVRQAQLHRRVGLVLSRSAGDEDHGELGNHFDRAGERELAARHATAAAERAMRQGAVAEAAHFYEMVARNSEDPHEVADATERYAVAHHLTRNISRANVALELAAVRLREVSQHARATRMDIRRVEAIAELGATPITELILRIARIKQQAVAQEDWQAVASALDVELRLTLLDERLADVRRVCEECREVLKMASPLGRAMAHQVLAVAGLTNDPAEAVESIKQALVLTDGSSEGPRLSILNRALILLHQRGEAFHPSALPIQNEALALAERTGDLHQRFVLEANIGVIHLDAGDLDGAQYHFEAAQALLGRADMSTSRINLAFNEAQLALETGDPEAAEVAFLRARDEGGLARPRYTMDVITAGLGLCAIEKGALSEARRFEERLGKPPRVWYYDPFLITSFRARLLYRRGERSRAIDILARASERLRGRLVPAWLKNQLLMASLLLKLDSGSASEVASEGLKVSQCAHFNARVDQFSRIVRRASVS